MRIYLFAVLIALATTARAQEASLAQVEAAALAGDYQAQRNLAYGYASYPMKGQMKDPTKACAWYLLVLRSDSPKLTVGDIGNLVVYCDKLDFSARLAAERQANALARRIYTTK